MLKSQNRRRNQNRALFSVGDTFKRRTKRHLGFAEADIAAKKPIHRAVSLHISLDFVHGSQLVVRFVEGEAAFKIVLHIRVG